MKIYFALGVAVSGLCASQASANDFPGARIEIVTGWDHARGKLSYKDSAFPEDNDSVSETTDGPIFGAAIGYDVRLNSSMYAGVELGADIADNKRCEEVYGDDAACFKLKRNIAVGARLGGRLTDGAMMYAGIAYVNGRGTLKYTDDLDPSNNLSISDDRDGKRLSTGVEFRLGGRFYGKFEYRYLDYKDYKYRLDETSKLSLGFDRHQVVGGVGARF